MELTFLELLEGLNGDVLIEKEDKTFNNVSIDTRKIEKDNIFFAIKGENFNGNNYIKEAFEKGASIAIIDEVTCNLEELSGKGTIIKVNNTDEALLRLANYYRNKLNIKVIGVTGSCGKTSSKDLIAAFLSKKYKVFKTKGNFNNQIGLPLMIFELNSSYDVAVLEMGMSDLGEIHVLAEAARPDYAIITNIGLSHIENLKTQENILKAKMEIVDFLTENNELIVNAEDSYLKNIISESFKVSKIGYNHEYDVYASNIILGEEFIKFTAHIQNESYEFTLPMAGKHNVLNSMLAIKVCNSLGVSLKEMSEGITNLEATSMRLQVIKKEKITLINDCYNASPDSMKSSLDVLSTYEKGRKVAILGTMNELGDKAIEAHTLVGEYARDKVDLLVVVGSYIKQFEEGFNSKNIKKYNTKEEFIADAQNVIKENDIVLIKASRGLKFEEIVSSLEKISV
ncbi:UDP-N-acetylmuramoyl-tripeptide--D-alanyl-D-alanine ligase [Clostridium sp.]|uniref:UDP-N-acetylmuramoyl-tripeptide--D-alanyl-D- alanine ligase n=1 Tax=Clostridium sp. TaxID=1506 RepID=UPI003F40DA97